MTARPTSQDVSPLVREVLVTADPARAFDAFTGHIGAWWPMASHSVYGAEATVSFEDDRLVERHGDQATVWGEVLEWEPPVRLRLTWHPGTDPDEATQVTVTFRAEGAQVRVRLTHTGWERRHDPDVRDRYATGWTFVLGRFAAAS
jgi:uncharacterized protein YndB with AHSA1/START domain